MSDTPRPDDVPEPTQPGQPSESPNELPPMTPDIDVPEPSWPVTDPSPTPISPVA